MPDQTQVERAERLGNACGVGMIAGESEWGVIDAGLIGARRRTRIGMVPEDSEVAPWLGLRGFLGKIVLLS